MKTIKKITQYPLTFSRPLVLGLNFCIGLSFISNVYALEVSISDYEKKIKNSYSVRNVSEKISNKELEDLLRSFLSKSRPSRIMGSPGHKKAQDFILASLRLNKSVDTQVDIQRFPLSEEIKQLSHLKSETAGENIVWRKKGKVSPEEEIIISAHYDTNIKAGAKIKNSDPMPGADNNASGVSVLLAMAKILDRLDLPKTVSIVFFDAEDRFNEGSQFFLKQNPLSAKFYTHIQVSMVGHDSKIQDKEKRYNNLKIYKNPNGQTNALEDVSAKFLMEIGKSNYPQLNITYMSLGTNSNIATGLKIGDSAESFWAKGVNSLIFTQDRENDLNPRLGTENDFAETLNYSTLGFVFKYLTTSVISWNYDIVK